jgi:hypothetical protein
MNELMTWMRNWVQGQLRKPMTWFVIFMALIIALQSIQFYYINKGKQLLEVELALINDSARIYRTKAGALYEQYNATEIERGALKKSLDLMGAKNKELRAKGVRWQNIIAYQKLQLHAAGHINAQVRDSIIHDTIPGKPIQIAQVVEWNNNHLFLNGLIFNKVFDGSYKYNVNLILATERKGKSVVVTGSLDDDNASIVTGSQINVTRKARWYEKTWLWGIGGFVGGILLIKN